MRFLCLHGRGSNSEIFMFQTAALRHELGDEHQFEFVDGTYSEPIAPELARVIPNATGGLAYYDEQDPRTFTKALDHLEVFIKEEGPFDGIFAFSQGAQLAASYLLSHRFRTKATQPIRCAVFLSAISAVLEDEGILSAAASNDETADQVRLRLAIEENIGDVAARISLPVAHVWGANDTLYPGSAESVFQLCDPAYRSLYIHAGGHDVPNTSARADMVGAIKAIKRSIDRCASAQ